MALEEMIKGLRASNSTESCLHKQKMKPFRKYWFRNIAINTSILTSLMDSWPVLCHCANNKRPTCIFLSYSVLHSEVGLDHRGHFCPVACWHIVVNENKLIHTHSIFNTCHDHLNRFLSVLSEVTLELVLLEQFLDGDSIVNVVVNNQYFALLFNLVSLWLNH